jgi:uncharacterized membrane protein
MTTKIGTLVIFVFTGVTLISCKHDSVQPQSDLLFPKVKAIIQTNCLTCHVPGGEGMPVFLNSDDNIVSLAEAIKHATVDPPSPMNPRMPLGGELSDGDKKIIADWYAGGGTASN